jgi:hypothetical protein
MYAVSADGRRFLIPLLVPPNGAASGQSGPDVARSLTITLNWASSLKK